MGCQNHTVSRDKIVARWQLHTSWLRCGRGRGRGHGRRRGRRLTVSEEAKLWRALWRDCGVIPTVDFDVLVFEFSLSRVSPPAVPPELSTAVPEA